MKKAIIIALMLMGACAINAQTTVKKDGKIIKTVQSTKVAKGEAKKTGFQLEKDGITYDIYISSTGRCYINKVSKKTGKTYKDYQSVDKTEPWNYIPGAKQPNPKSK